MTILMDKMTLPMDKMTLLPGGMTPFATPECLWSTYGPTLRAEDRPEAFFATRGCH